MEKLIGVGLAGVLGLAAVARLITSPALFSARYLPHRFCYLSDPAMVWTNAMADGLIAVAYVLLFSCLLWLASKLRNASALRQYLWIFVGFGLFILACGFTHVLEIVTIWSPVYPLAAAFKVA